MRANLPAVVSDVHPVDRRQSYWMDLSGARATYPRGQMREEGGITLIASAYHVVLAVKDERGARSPPAAVFDP